MTNAVFATDPLPLKAVDTPKTDFESALMDYFSFYSPSRTGELVSRLKRHDFTTVKAHFIASVPGKFEGESANKWGLGRLKKLLRSIESHPRTELFGQVFSNAPPETYLSFHQLVRSGRMITGSALSSTKLWQQANLLTPSHNFVSSIQLSKMSKNPSMDIVLGHQFTGLSLLRHTRLKNNICVPSSVSGTASRPVENELLPTSKRMDD
jgi:hypothetical protein